VFGSNTSAIAAGGENPPAPGVNKFESWNGTSWTEIAEANTPTTAADGSGTDNTSGIIFGRNPAPGDGAKTELWNGSAWTEINDLSTARAQGGSNTVGGGTSAFLAGGQTPPDQYKNQTEEWTAAVANSTITVS